LIGKETERKIMLEKNIIAKYDLNNYLYEQIEYFKNNKKEFCEMLDIENTDDEKIEKYFYNDDFESNWYYQNFLDNIDDEFKKHVDKNVNVVAKNMGWRNLSGEKNFILERPIDIINQIKVNSDFNMYIYKLDKNKYHIKQSHHDAPTGENYYITITK
jgi:hypothetical protein